MKRMLCILLALACLCLTACSFNSNFSDSLGATEMAATLQVAEMLEALTYQDMEAALALMHPETIADAADRERVTSYLQQMMDYMDGRKHTAMEQLSLNVKNSSGTSGSIKQESASFLITVPDANFHIAVVYLTENGQSGFTSFQLVLGVV